MNGYVRFWHVAVGETCRTYCQKLSYDKEIEIESDVLSSNLSVTLVDLLVVIVFTG